MQAVLFDLKNHCITGKDYKVYIHMHKDEPMLHYHDYYEVILILSDNIIHKVNDSEQILKPGSLIFIRPTDRHTLTANGSDFRLINMNFSARTMIMLLEYFGSDKLRENLLSPEMPPVVVLNETEKSSLAGKLKRIAAYQYANDDEKDPLMRLTLAELIVNYYMDIPDESRPQIPEWLMETVREMNKPVNFAQGFSRMVEISEKNKDYLSRCIQKYFGIKPTSYINSLRLEYVSSMLISSDIPIMSLWMECGFQSAAYFYKLFHDVYEMTPKEYRDKFGGKQL